MCFYPAPGSLSCRFQFDITVSHFAPLGLHFASTLCSLRFHLTALRSHFDFARHIPFDFSLALFRFHLEFTSVSHRCHFGFTRTSLRVHVGIIREARLEKRGHVIGASAREPPKWKEDRLRRPTSTIGNPRMGASVTWHCHGLAAAKPGHSPILLGHPCL